MSQQGRYTVLLTSSFAANVYLIVLQPTARTGQIQADQPQSEVAQMSAVRERVALGSGR